MEATFDTLLYFTFDGIQIHTHTFEYNFMYVADVLFSVLAQCTFPSSILVTHLHWTFLVTKITFSTKMVYVRHPHRLSQEQKA